MCRALPSDTLLDEIKELTLCFRLRSSTWAWNLPQLHHHQVQKNPPAMAHQQKKEEEKVVTMGIGLLLMLDLVTKMAVVIMGIGLLDLVVATNLLPHALEAMRYSMCSHLLFSSCNHKTFRAYV